MRHFNPVAGRSPWKAGRCTGDLKTGTPGLLRVRGVKAYAGIPFKPDRVCLCRLIGEPGDTLVLRHARLTVLPYATDSAAVISGSTVESAAESN